MTSTSGSDHSPMVFVAPICCLWQCGHSQASSPLSWRITFHESNTHERNPNQWEGFCKLFLFQFQPLKVVSGTGNSPLHCMIKYIIYNYNHRNITLYIHILMVQLIWNYKIFKEVHVKDGIKVQVLFEYLNFCYWNFLIHLLLKCLFLYTNLVQIHVYLH